MKIPISTENPKVCRAIANDPRFISEELYTSEPNGHKFEPGQVCTLVGLVDYPEYNGQTVVVTSIREDGRHGRAYYVQGEINAIINWVYEYRLSA